MQSCGFAVCCTLHEGPVFFATSTCPSWGIPAFDGGSLGTPVCRSGCSEVHSDVSLCGSTPHTPKIPIHQSTNQLILVSSACRSSQKMRVWRRVLPVYCARICAALGDEMRAGFGGNIKVYVCTGGWAGEREVEDGDDGGRRRDDRAPGGPRRGRGGTGCVCDARLWAKLLNCLVLS